MWVYLLVGAVVTGFAKLSEIVNNRLALTGKAQTKRVEGVIPDPFLIIALLILAVFSGARYFVGTDFRLYSTLYSQIYKNDLALSIERSPQEIGYTTLSWAVRQFTDYPLAIFWVVSFLTVLFTAWAILRSTKQTALAFFLYFFMGFYFNSLNIQRQTLSVSMVFLAETYFKKSWTKYILLNVGAVLVHISAIIPIIMLLLVRKWNPTIKQVIMITVACFLLAVSFLSLPQLAEWLAVLNPRYEGYLEETAAAGIGTYFLILVRFVLILFILWLSLGMDKPKYLPFVVLSLPFLILGTVSVPVARVELYFSIFLILVLPKVLNESPRSKPWMTKVVIVFFLVYGIIYLISFNDLLPYEWSFGKILPPLS